MVRKIFFSVLPAIGLVFCNPVHAESMDFVRHAQVSYADLDLSKQKDRAVLERRVRVAIVKVCAGDGGILPITEIMQCREKAYEASHRQLAAAYTRNDNLVLAAQAGRGG